MINLLLTLSTPPTGAGHPSDPDLPHDGRPFASARRELAAQPVQGRSLPSLARLLQRVRER
jgi:hypothetical protein